MATSTQATGASLPGNSVVENLRPLRVVVIGAGFSGILAAIRYSPEIKG
jgi:hypothetical protein